MVIMQKKKKRKKEKEKSISNYIERHLPTFDINKN